MKVVWIGHLDRLARFDSSTEASVEANSKVFDKLIKDFHGIACLTEDACVHRFDGWKVMWPEVRFCGHPAVGNEFEMDLEVGEQLLSAEDLGDEWLTWLRSEGLLNNL